jgi:putative endonuclease
MDRRALGARAEQMACDHLEARGFRIVGRNVRVGPKELDVIAQRGGLVVFCEVRARTSASFLSPLASIDAKKVRNVRAAARAWLLVHRLRVAVRFDAAGVTFEVPEGRMEFVEDAF